MAPRNRSQLSVLSIGLLSLGMLACDPAVSPDGGAALGCESSANQGTVVACGLAPGLALFGADADAFYGLNGNRTWFRISRGTGKATRLYHSLQFNWPNAEATAFLSATKLQDGKIYLADSMTLDGKRRSGILTIDPGAPATPSFVAPTEYSAAVSFVLDEQYAYFQDGLDPRRPLVRAPLAGGAVQQLFAKQSTPFAVRDGYVYFVTADETVQRAPITGGPATVIIPELPHLPKRDGSWFVSYFDLGIDAEYVYVPVPGMDQKTPHTIKRYANKGGDSGTVAATLPLGSAEVPVDPPKVLRIDGDYIYFLQHSLNRIRLDGSGSVETLIDSKAPPLFDHDSIYVTRQNGGVDAPLEGTIVRLPR